MKGKVPQASHIHALSIRHVRQLFSCTVVFLYQLLTFENVQKFLTKGVPLCSKIFERFSTKCTFHQHVQKDFEHFKKVQKLLFF